MSKVSYLPMGQGKPGKSMEQGLDALKQNWTLKEIPSFEVWIAATCYDPTKEDGGPLFQAMMFHVLTEGSGGKLHIRQTTHYDVNTKTSAHVKPGSKEKVYAPKTQGLTSLNGGSTQLSNTSDPRFFDEPYDGNYRERKSRPLWELQSIGQVGVSYLAWWESAGMSRTMRTRFLNNCNAQSNSRQFTGPKSTGSSDIKKEITQDTGCLVLGNRMAAFYGLYYYPDCRKKEWNWYHEVTTHGKKFDVRMRMPNPAYELEFNSKGEPATILVKEVAKDGKWLGDELSGFEFPQVELPSRTAGLCWDWLAHPATNAEKETGLVTLLTAWAGFSGKEEQTDRSHPYADVTFDTSRRRTIYARGSKPQVNVALWADTWVDALKDSDWEGRMYDRRTSKRAAKFETETGVNKGELNFGWSFPAALWLYPHYTDAQTVSGPKDVGAGKRQKSLYQPWPDWKDNSIAYDFNYMTFTPKMAPLCVVLERAPLVTLANRQRYALKLDPKYFTEPHDAAYGKEERSVKYIQALYGALTGDQEPAPPADQSQGGFAVVGTQANTAKKPTATLPIAAKEAKQVEVSEITEGPYLPVDGDDDDVGESGADAVNAENQRQQLTAIDMHNGDSRPASIAASDDMVDGDIEADLAAVDSKVRQKLLNKVAKADEPMLEPGAPRRNNDTDGNEHFYSLAFSPWAPQDVYRKPEHGFDVSNTMNATEVEAYEKRYGSVSNLLLRSNVPAKLEFVYNDYGEELREGHFSGRKDGRRILDMPLDSYTNTSLPAALRELFAKNMRRILSIYYDESGELGTANRIDVATKRKGMMNGIYVPNARAAVQCPDVNYDKGFRILKPVFSTKLKALKKNPFVTAEKTLWRGAANQPKTTKDWLAYETASVDDVRSDMTVLEWLQTPWHYEYLPYQPMNSVFKDGETYCSGCTRCSRPFYEYKYMYATYWLAVDYTTHWQHQYWRADTKGEQDHRYAPLPFHEPRFWSREEVMAKTRTTPPDTVKIGGKDGIDFPAGVQAARAEIDNNPAGEDGVGYHNWPTHLFLLGYTPTSSAPYFKQNGQHTAKSYVVNNAHPNSGPLAEEWTRRYKKLQHLVMAHRNSQPWTFRRYINHTYDPEHKDSKGELGYDELVQGVVRSKGARVCYGMQKYKLMRSIKYGNVCRDCANTLDIAPKQYLRTGRVTAHLLNVTSGQLRPGATQLDTWWLPLANTRLKDGTLFDPWFLYIQTAGLHKPRVADGHYTQGANRAHTYKQLTDSGVLAKDDSFRQQLVDALGKGKGKVEAYKLLFPRLPTDENKKTYRQRIQERIDLHLEKVMEYTKRNACLVRAKGPDGKESMVTKVIKPPDVYVQKYYDRAPTKWQQGSQDGMQAATKILQRIIEWLDESYEPHDNAGVDSKSPPPVTPSKKALVLDPSEGGGKYNRALRDVLHEAHYTMAHLDAYAREPTAPKFDPELERVETRLPDKLIIQQLVTPGHRELKSNDVGQRPTYETKGEQVIKRTYTRANSDWEGDDYVRDYNLKVVAAGGEAHPSAPQVQRRKLTQTRLFITYSLHRRVFSELEARFVLERMGDAVRTIFGNDQELCQLILFGQRLREYGSGDSVSSKTYVPIDAPRKKETRFYGGQGGRNSYTSDRYMTHVESVSVDAGMEIGPTYHHPHFHCLLTVNHFSYIQFDTFKMKATLEQMFKGTHKKYKQEFMLLDGAGLPFYTDNENPYIDIRLYPSDNWAEVVAAYVRKGADKESMMALRARTGDTQLKPSGDVQLKE